MQRRNRIKAGIVALERRTYQTCSMVTLQFPAEGPARGVGGGLLVTLTLCEWQRVAKQIAEAASALGS